MLRMMKEWESLPCGPVDSCRQTSSSRSPGARGRDYFPQQPPPSPAKLPLSVTSAAHRNTLSPVFSGAVLLEEAGNAHTRSCAGGDEELWQHPGASS